jgi:hypothetical protein
VYGALADATVVLHAAFVAFVILGGLLVLRWPRLAWVHLPAAIWGVLIEYAGWICPLTPLEMWFRDGAGEAGYSGGFVDHYIMPVLYPVGLSRSTQFVLGTLVLVINLALYTILIVRRRRANAPRRRPSSHPVDR